MKIVIEKYSAASKNTELLVLPLSKPAKSGGKRNWLQSFHPDSVSFLKQLDSKLNGELRDGIKKSKFQVSANARTLVALSNPLRSLFLGGVDDFSEPFNGESWRSLGGHTARLAQNKRAANVVVLLACAPKNVQTKAIQPLVEGLLLGAYAYNEYKSESKKPVKCQITIAISQAPATANKASLRLGKSLAEATIHARDLVNRPPSDLQPLDLANAARSITKTKNSRLKIRVLRKAELKKIGANGILGVSQGSDAQPCMIELRYKPSTKAKGAKKIVLVGKGVTYDSGGLSIKTRAGMETMKCDMGGAAAVIGAMEAIDRSPRSLIKHEIIGLIPATENMINGKSLKPGDVLTALNGKTIEVLNTDAEGRLILADALAYSKRYKADITIDLATLTGACVAALGDRYAGLFSNDQELTNQLIQAGDSTGELLWRLPLDDVYRPLIGSAVADIKNTAPGGPGATTAALILKEFVPTNTRWAHIDIAGPAFISRPTSYIPKGGTGFGVRAIFEFVQKL